MTMVEDDKWLQQILRKEDYVVQVLAMDDNILKAPAKEMMSTTSLVMEIVPWRSLCTSSRVFA